MGGRRLLCYGDSLTAGYIAESPYTQQFAPWAPVLEQELGVPCDVIGASGWTTTKMLDLSHHGGIDACRIQQPGLAKALRGGVYSVVILMGGTNDLGVADADKIFANLRDLHAQCHAAGCVTIALTIPQGRQLGPWTHGKPVAFANERRVQVNEALEAWAGTQDGCVLFVAMDEDVPWTSDSTHWERDGLHMSAAGYARFGELLAPKVRDYVLGAIASNEQHAGNSSGDAGGASLLLRGSRAAAAAFARTFGPTPRGGAPDKMQS